MRTPRFHSATLVELLERVHIATMEDFKHALGTDVDMTVLRKLREIPYITSYSHRGGYYALRSMAEFDDRGLWSHAGVHFSEGGSLIDTVVRFVTNASTGYLASELVEELHVEVKQPLLRLLRTGRVAREDLHGVYLYTSVDPKRRRQQSLARQACYVHEPFSFIDNPDSAPDEVKAGIILFLSTLDEQQRRLFAGLESLRIGRGGDRRIAEWTGMDVHTVARGRRALEQHDIRVGRVRRPGGGRRPVEKKRRK